MFPYIYLHMHTGDLTKVTKLTYSVSAKRCQSVNKWGKTIQVDQLLIVRFFSEMQKTIYIPSNSVRWVLELLKFSSFLVNHWSIDFLSFLIWSIESTNEENTVWKCANNRRMAEKLQFRILAINIKASDKQRQHYFVSATLSFLYSVLICLHLWC